MVFKRFLKSRKGGQTILKQLKSCQNRQKNKVYFIEKSKGVNLNFLVDFGHFFKFLKML
jgi:hypothetical protein